MSRFLALASLSTAALLAVAAPANATLFSGSYVVNTSGDPGLAIQTNHGPGSPGSLNVDVAVNGGSTALNNLFRLWTNEESVNQGEDTIASPISVNFSFTLPAPFGAADPGSTVGFSETAWIWFVPYNEQWGDVTWNDPVSFETSFGTVTIDLDDASFNWGVWGLTEGPCYGADISGTISAVPEPLSISLLGFGLLATGFAVRRRRALGR